MTNPWSEHLQCSRRWISSCELAEQLDADGRAAELLDHRWHLVWVSDQFGCLSRRLSSSVSCRLVRDIRTAPEATVASVGFFRRTAYNGHVGAHRPGRRRRVPAPPTDLAPAGPHRRQRAG